MKEAVHESALKLDELKPGWEERIDRERLNMASGRECILGQEYPTFSEGLEAMGVSKASEGGCGLPSSTENPRLEWKNLQALWIEQIECRLFATELEGAKSEEIAVA